MSECESKVLQLISFNMKLIVQWVTNKCQWRKCHIVTTRWQPKHQIMSVLSLHMSQHLEKDLQALVASNSGRITLLH